MLREDKEGIYTPAAERLNYLRCHVNTVLFTFYIRCEGGVCVCEFACARWESCVCSHVRDTASHI